MITERARRLAEEHAARDRADLADLIRRGVVRRDEAFTVPGSDEFLDDMASRTRPRAVNLAIRPKKKGRRR